jgi:hypothetical protein
MARANLLVPEEQSFALFFPTDKDLKMIERSRTYGEFSSSGIRGVARPQATLAMVWGVTSIFLC